LPEPGGTAATTAGVATGAAAGAAATDSFMIRAMDVGCRFSLSYDRYYTIPQFLLARLRDWRAKKERRPFWALRNVTFDVAPGDVLGVIGRNGAGKSTLMRLLGGVFRPDEGRILVRGRTSVLLALGTGFNMALSGRENVFLTGLILGLSRRDVQDRFEEIVRFAEMEEFVDVPCRFYSTGMLARLSFAIATSIEPDILMIDETFSVGDAAFERKTKARMETLQARAETQILISHDLELIKDRCNKVLYLRRGRVQYFGDPQEAIDRYLVSVEKDAAEAGGGDGRR
jgi:ABC-type polysaccharide/polyol phosphate transport system ATPase subunit